MRTRTPKSVVNSRGCLVTATTAAQSLTRTTRHGLPSNRMTSPARRRKELFMANFLWIEKRRLRCVGSKAQLIGLGALAGDALAIQRNRGKQIERVRRKTELMLRQRQAAFGSFHGINQAKK